MIEMGNKKILIADDEVHIVQVVAMKFRNNGFEVVTADNGKEAYNLCCEENPDIIVTDYQMPGMTGIELVEKLRQKPEFADIPVIILTARGFAIEDEQKDKLRITECLGKPFSPKELLVRVESVLEHSTVE
ncbi:MAG: response regulator [Planctomycetes bacterium]|nr:response regulator [Planctomycetota bacterium]MBU1518820.1 response regulator [Planctomycetota bacterium]MBU2596694.1 response regulator [Planctomycetota bacterium]